MYGGYFSFSLLTTISHFSLNQMSKKAHDTEKSVRQIEIVLLKVHNYQYKQAYL